MNIHICHFVKKNLLSSSSRLQIELYKKESIYYKDIQEINQMYMCEMHKIKEIKYISNKNHNFFVYKKK